MGKKKHNRHDYKKPETLLSIIIPVYGCFDLLKMCLEAIPAACDGLSYHVLVVDNASPDYQGFYEQYRQPWLTVIRSHDNLGYLPACNLGVQEIKSPLVLFYNSDVVALPGSITKLVRELDDPTIGIAGMKLLFPEGSQSGPAGKVQHVGLESNIRGEMDHIFLGWSPNNPKVLAVRDVLAVTGAALLTRRQLFKEMRGFFTGYGKGTFEDVDYCLSVQGIKQLRVVVSQDAVGYHYTGASVLRYRQGFPLGMNQMIFMSRWAGKYPWTEWRYA